MKTTSSIRLLALAAAWGLVTSAHGQMLISSGIYQGTAGANNNSGGPGGGGGPGYSASGSGTSYSILGGTFTGGMGGTGYTNNNGGNGGDGLDVSALTSITGGSFGGGTGGTSGAYQAGGGGVFVTQKNGGQGGSAVDALSSGTLNIYGGTFSAGTAGAAGSANLPGVAGYSFLVGGGATTLYGTFTGGVRTITSGAGTITGTLADNTTSATYTYDVTGGSLTLSAPLVPEPSTWALLGLGGAGLLGMILRRRSRARLAV